MGGGDSELIFEQRDGDVSLLRLNRPRAKNSVSFTMWEQFSRALDVIENGTPPRALILCGRDDPAPTSGPTPQISPQILP